MSHHDELITMARQDGWIPGAQWRAGLRKVAKGDKHLTEECSYILGEMNVDLPCPDAWRITTEDRGIILAFLEVEVTSGISQKKDERYRWMWWVFDDTMNFILEIWHMDRFGVVRPYIVGSEIYPPPFGMNAGWRS